MRVVKTLILQSVNLSLRIVSLSVLALCGLLLCANADADRVDYQLTFDATWSNATHPIGFPPGPHFSGLIGGTHNSDIRFWELGGLATPGIESMAETGSKSNLLPEVNAAIAAGTAYNLLSGGGIGNSPGLVQMDFSVDSRYPLVSVVSMIAPSPDWFVGVTGLSLLGVDHWFSEIVVPLSPYDAGTDSGLNYTSVDANTDPQEPIYVINDGPFLDSPPLGTFTFRLTTGDFDASQSHTAADIDELSQAIRINSTEARFDLNGDGSVDGTDRTYWVERLFGSYIGDANLDSVVDGSDFNVWNDHRGGAATWATGDFNGDFVADGADWELLSANLFSPGRSESPVNATVPEPGFSFCFWCLLSCDIFRRVRQQSHPGRSVKQVDPR